MIGSSAYPWYAHLVAWWTLIAIVILFALGVVRAVKGVSNLFSRGPNVDADVRSLYIENMNVNQDPTRPDDRYAAVNEFRQHWKGG